MSQPSERVTVRRKPERGAYDTATVHAILDEAPFCHVGITDDEGQPYVIPTIHARVAGTLYLHGSPASRLLRRAKQGVGVCVTATILDGLVLARSAFHHSMNYRSVVVLGTASVVDDHDEKLRAAEAIVEHVAPGRWSGCRPPSDDELRSTLMVAVPIAEASAKIRTGGAVDDEADLGLDHWAGVVPVTSRRGSPEQDALLPPGIEVPAHVRDLVG